MQIISQSIIFLCQKFDPNTNFHVSIYVTLGANGACHNETKCCLVYNIAQKMKGIVRQVFVTVWKGCTYTGEKRSYCHDAKQFFIFLSLPLFNSKALCDIFCIRVVEYMWGNALAEKLGSPLAMQHVFISEKKYSGNFFMGKHTRGLDYCYRGPLPYT